MRRRLFIAGLCVLWFGLAVRYAAQSGMSVTPANRTIVVGQTQQFTANGSVTVGVVAAGGEYACVRLADGTAQCTGRNQFGQLGDGSWTDFSVLVPVSGITTATRVTAGDEFACALLSNGTAKCWGLGESGQRGDGNFDTFALDACRGERPHRRGRPRGRLWPHVRAALERHDAVLGREPRRAARERDHGQPGDAAAGRRQRHQRRNRVHHRRVSHLRRAGERHGAVLGPQSRPARKRHLHELVDAGGGHRSQRRHGRQRRRRAHVRRVDGRHGAVLGRKCRGSTRQRDDHDLDDAGAGRRPFGRRRCQRRLAPHLRAAGQRHDPVLGAGPVRATR